MKLNMKEFYKAIIFFILALVWYFPITGITDDLLYAAGISLSWAQYTLLQDLPTLAFVIVGLFYVGRAKILD